MTDLAADRIAPSAGPVRGILRSHRVRVGLAALLVLAVGVGAYLLSSSLSSSSGSPVLAAPARPLNPGGHGPGGLGGPLGAIGSGARPVVAGTVVSTGSNSFKMTTRTGTTVTVTVSSSTSYVGGSLSSLKDGERVVVFGTSTSSTEVHATRVLVGLAGRGPGGFGGSGRFGGGPGGNGQATA